MSDLQPTPPAGLQLEYVPCALCGSSDARPRFLVPFANRRLANLWQGEQARPLEGSTAVVQCRQCGLAYINPRIAEQPGMTTYSAGEEEQYFASTFEARRRTFDDLLDRVPKWLGRSPSSLIDIGCGDGLLLGLALERGWAASGVETSETLLDQLAKQFGSAAGLYATIESLPDAAYDVVALINVIEHIRQPQPFLRQLRRIIQPGGVLVIHAPNFNGLPARLRGPNWHQIEPLEHIYYYTAHTLGNMLRKTGFHPTRRFNLVGASGWKAVVQRSFGKLGIYLDSGLGMVAVPSE